MIRRCWYAVQVWIRTRLRPLELPVHLKRGSLGERAAASHLKAAGFQILATNYRCETGEVDLIARNQECLVFVEVKTRSKGQWLRPAAAVNRRKRQRLCRTALRYLRDSGNPSVRIRFDIVEVILRNEAVETVHHLPNAFPMQDAVIYPV
jgi:putative endonuclease